VKHWSFLNFVNEHGRNAIADWIAAQPSGTRQRLKSRLNTVLMNLEIREALDRPLVGQLHGGCKGLYELVLYVDKIAFRPIGCFGPEANEFTLLVGAEERGGKLVPSTICDTAQTRRKLISQRRHVCAHRFD
jgi:hypothetical protein